jgi:hypothetical protein
MIRILMTLLMGFFAASGGYFAYEALRINSDEKGHHDSSSGGPSSGGGIHGAPGPVAGAGLPVVAVGYGVYWLVRRRRQASSKQPQADRYSVL